MRVAISRFRGRNHDSEKETTMVINELENGLTIRDRLPIECSTNKKYLEGQVEKKRRITSRNRDMYGVVESWLAAYCFDRLVYYKKGAALSSCS